MPKQPSTAPEPTAAPAWAEPAVGGSYTRDPVTGALTLVSSTAPAADAPTTPVQE
ncbi:MAG: hypothetical protein ACKVIH_01500 [Burkholderiales bacterium]